MDSNKSSSLWSWEAWGWASLMIVILIIGGIQMIMLELVSMFGELYPKPEKDHNTSSIIFHTMRRIWNNSFNIH